MEIQINPPKNKIRFRLLIVLISLLLTMFGIQTSVFAEEYSPVTIQLNGQPIMLEGQGAVRSGDVIYVPAITLFEKLNVKVEWSEISNTIYGYQGEALRFEFNPSSSFGKLDEQHFLMDAQPIVINDTILVPSSFITQVVRYPLEFDSQSNVLQIHTKQLVDIDPYAKYHQVKKELEAKYNLTEPKEKVILSRIQKFLRRIGISL